MGPRRDRAGTAPTRRPRPGPVVPVTVAAIPDPFLGSLLARCTFPARGTGVVAGVSGGADSTALLALGGAARCVGTAVHVDHGLRADSGLGVDHVAGLAGQVGAGFRSVRVVVG